MKTGSLFVGSQNECKKYVRRIEGWYVYILRRPDGQPFYIGKGKDYRVFGYENEARHPNDFRSNPYKLNVIRGIKKHGAEIAYEIDSITDNEETVLHRESELINGFKRLHEGGPLTNLDPGGISTSGSAPLSKNRHTATLAGEPDDNPDRAILNRFILNISSMQSVIFKPTNQFIARPTQRYPNKKMGQTLRQATALVASAAVNSISMDGTCYIPRRVMVDGVAGIVENGVSCDILTSGLGDVIPAKNPVDEIFQLSAEQARKSVNLVGLNKCYDLGVISSQTYA